MLNYGVSRRHYLATVLLWLTPLCNGVDGFVCMTPQTKLTALRSTAKPKSASSEPSIVDYMRRERNSQRQKKNIQYGDGSQAAKQRRQRIEAESGADAQRAAMLQHRILTKAEELALGEHVQRANKVKEQIIKLVQEKEKDMDRRQQQQQQNDVFDSEFLYEEPIDESLLYASGREVEERDDYSVNSIYGRVHTVEDELNDENEDSDGDTNVDDDTSDIDEREEYELLLREEQHRQNRRQLKGKTIPKNTRGRSKAKIDADIDIDQVITNPTLLTDEEIRAELGLKNRKELRRLFQKAMFAKEELVRCNIKLVVSIAKKWAKQSIPSVSLIRIYSGSSTRPSLDEAIQEGIVGLATAAERFDPKRGFRFSTYSTYWITNHVRSCYQNAVTAPLRIPQPFHSIKHRCMTLRKSYHDAGIPVPDNEELAEELGVTPSRLRKVLKYTRPLLSLDSPSRRGASLRGSGGIEGTLPEVGDFVQSNEDGPEKLVELSLLRQCLENAMAAELSPYERDVVRLRVGLDDGISRTAKQVVEFCGNGVTINDVRSAENRAYTKLRSHNSIYTSQLLSYLDEDVDTSSIR